MIRAGTRARIVEVEWKKHIHKRYFGHKTDSIFSFGAHGIRKR